MKRRSFLKTAAATALGIQIVPRHVLGGDGHTPPSEKLNLASIGVGGMGGSDIGSLAAGPIAMIAVCDVDERNRNAAAGRFPGAKPFADWRELLDQLDKQIDAVSVSTPDHMHAPISMSAIHRGKHVYCQKPMTHTIYEARQIAAAARKAKVVTQMGIQIHSSIEYRMATELIQGGAIGKIKEVHSWSDRPGAIWPQGRSAAGWAEPRAEGIEVGPLVGRSAPAAVCPGRLCTRRMAGFFGLRLRGPGRHGLPYHRPALHGLEAQPVPTRFGSRDPVAPTTCTRRGRSSIMSSPARSSRPARR